MITFIWGPPGSGKTRNKDFLQGKFGAKRVLDDYDAGQEIKDGDLVLLQEKPKVIFAGTQVFHIADALRR